jgi:hypothetical protein
LLENKIFKENYVSKEQGFNCALGNNHVPEGTRAYVASGTTMLLGEKTT